MRGLDGRADGAVFEQVVDVHRVDGDRPEGSHHDGVGAVRVGGEDPHVGEGRGEGAVDGLDVVGRHLIELHPLHEEAIGRHRLLRRAEVVEGEEVGDAGDPGVGGLGDHHVVPAVGTREVVAAVVVDEVQPGHAHEGKLALAGEGEVVDVGEVAGGVGDPALELHVVDAAHGKLKRGADGDAGAEAHDGDVEVLRAAGVEQQRVAGDQHLRGHVVAVGGVDLAVVLEGEVHPVGAQRPALDGHRGGDAVAVVDRVVAAEVLRPVAGA